MDAMIYHNPEYGRARPTLATIRNAGIEQRAIDYLHRAG
jgi:hypothetical protein